MLLMLITGRKLMTRLPKPFVEKPHSLLSIVGCNHDFDWKNTKILDEERSYVKRLMSERMYINL